MGLTLHASVEGFFREVLLDALGSEGVSAGPQTELYLVGLLGEFAHQPIAEGALALRLAEAASDRAERVVALKEVGDTSLYLTGFFSESIERQLVGRDYYRDLGSAAYHELALQLKDSSVAVVYAELSAKFPRFVDVLTQVRKRVRCGQEDIVALFQEWRESRDEWVEKRLRELGVLVGDDKGYLQ